MTWIRNGSFLLLPSGLEITLSDEARRHFITIKGYDSQTVECAAGAVLGALNPTVNLIADVRLDHSVDEVAA